ncbi:MAG: hypothetical protein D6791_11740, partial [Chloroflexi bacterium]
TIRGEIEHAARVLRAQVAVGDDEAVALLHQALEEELALARNRVFLLLSFLYEARPILRAEEQIANGDGNAQALALETLEVTLSGELKATVIALVDPKLTLEKRLAALGGQAAASDRDFQLRAIIADPERVWTHGWTRACAIYAAGRLGLTALRDAIQSALKTESEHPIPETARWALQQLTV